MKIVQVPFKDYYHEEARKRKSICTIRRELESAITCTNGGAAINHGLPLALLLIVTEQLSKDLAQSIGLTI
jgi:hypothetical protein